MRKHAGYTNPEIARAEREPIAGSVEQSDQPSSG